jgi:Zn-dependent protease
VAHEYAHAVAAYRQGDDTAYMLGRITLNPLPHIDPIMSIAFPAITFLLSGGSMVFGGAKPVPVNPRKYRNYKKGDIIVSAAGVATNFVLCFVFALLFVLLGLVARTAPSMVSLFDAAQQMMMWGVWLNLLLCFFNLIPIPPLDGSHIFYYLLPPAWGAKYRELHRFGFIFVLLLVSFLRPVLAWFLTPAFLLLNTVMRTVAPFAVGDGWKIFG